MAAERVNERYIVLEMLLELGEGVPSHIILDDTLYKYAYLEKRQRAFITRLFTGTIENRLFLDFVIGQFSHVKIKKIKPVVKEALRMAVYQLFFMDRVPESAAVNESVKLVRKYGLNGLVPFANGILRNIVRNKDKIQYPDRKSEHDEYMSVMYSMPLWLVRHFNKEYGNSGDGIIEALSCGRPLYIRVNTGKIRPEELIDKFLAQGIEAKASPLRSDMLKIEGVDSLVFMPEFEEGLFTVQDVSSSLAVFFSGVKEGDKVIDLCAAPGGKTCDLAAIAGNSGRVLSFDISEEKVRLIEENVSRLGLENVDIAVNDATIFKEELMESADLVFCDLPCSGLGIMARKPDIKYNSSEEKIRELSLLQKKILDNAVKYVKFGGTLLFSTCTMTKAENEENFRYISEKKGFSTYGFDNLLIDEFTREEKKEASGGYLRLIPGAHDTDGFFISRFKKYE